MSSARKKVSHKDLDKFSLEILLHIFDYLDPILLFGAVALVNKKMKEIVYNPHWLWVEKLPRHFQTQKKYRNSKKFFIKKFKTKYADLSRDARVLMSFIRERDTESLAIKFQRPEKDSQKIEALLFEKYQKLTIIHYLQALNHQETMDHLYAQLEHSYDMPSVGFNVLGWLGWRATVSRPVRILAEWAILCRQPFEKLAQLIPPEYDLRTLDQQNDALLYFAAGEGYEPAVAFICERLKSNPADLDIGSIDGSSSPLYIAAQRNRLAALLTLLANGANPDIRFRGEYTPLYAAAQNGNLSIVLALLDEGVAIDAACNHGSTPLYIASQQGHLAVVNVLLNHGANAEARFGAGFTPLYVASRNGHAGVVKRLLKAGANIEENSGDGSTPLYVASQNGHASVVRVLLNAHANLRAVFLGYHCLYIAAQNGHDLVVKRIMNYLRVSPWYEGSRDEIMNFARVGGETALYAAVQNGHAEIVARLVENGADMNAIYNGRYRPIHLAAAENHFEIVKFLIKNGALVLGCPIDELEAERPFNVLLALKAYLDKANLPQQPNLFQPPNLRAQRLAVGSLLSHLLDVEDSTTILEGLWDKVKEYGVTDPALCLQLEQFSGTKPQVPIPRRH